MSNLEVVSSFERSAGLRSKNLVFWTALCSSSTKLSMRIFLRRSALQQRNSSASVRSRSARHGRPEAPALWPSRELHRSYFPERRRELSESAKSKRLANGRESTCRALRKFVSLDCTLFGQFSLYQARRRCNSARVRRA